MVLPSGRYQKLSDNMALLIGYAVEEYPVFDAMVKRYFEDSYIHMSFFGLQNCRIYMNQSQVGESKAVFDFASREANLMLKHLGKSDIKGKILVAAADEIMMSPAITAQLTLVGSDLLLALETEKSGRLGKDLALAAAHRIRYGYVTPSSEPKDRTAKAS